MKQILTLCLMSILMVLAFSSIASAVGNISSIEVGGISVRDGDKIAGFYRDTIPVRVTFSANEVFEDVRIRAWFAGSGGNVAVTERFDILSSSIYSRLVAVPLPEKLSNEITEETYTLNVVIESREKGEIASDEVTFKIQRVSYGLEILDVEVNNKVSAGDVVSVSVVIKNIGRQFADDSFVRVRIPELGIEDRDYLGDLSPLDQGGSVVEKEDSAEAVVYLKIPSNVGAGVYTLEVEAFNDDSSDVVKKKIAIVGANEETDILSPVKSKLAKVGESVEYDIVLVNDGKSVRVYELVVDAPAGLKVQLDEPVVALASGTSKTIKAKVSALSSGSYEFRVNVHAGSSLIKQETFTIKAEGSKVSGNAMVLLTVILVIVFVVLLIVLIVLLTKKPLPVEGEFGKESYY